MARNPTYYEGDLATDLVDAAIAAIDTGGTSAVSLRSLARELGVSNAAPKHHFPDKSSLFAAIAIAGFDSLQESMRRAVGADDDEALVEAGVAYVGYALEHPAHFAVMWQADLFGDDPAVIAARQSTFGVLVEIVAGKHPGGTPDDANRAWALAHGWAALLQSGSLHPPSGERTLDYVRRQLAATDIGSA